MKLPFEIYRSEWTVQFHTIKKELQQELALFLPDIEHIGSTAVTGLSAKPIIDVMVGVHEESDLDGIPDLLKGKKYVYYEKYNNDMPYRRFFLQLKNTAEYSGVPDIVHIGEEIPEKLHDHELRLAHIHVIPLSSEHWLRHIAFRDYLRTHPEIVKQYQALKEELIKQDWKDGNDYNAGKEAFLKREEQHAVKWYKNQLK